MALNHNLSISFEMEMTSGGKTGRAGSKRKSFELIAKMEHDLLSGQYRPGEWLKQTDIEERYGAHRFDVRMALKDLSARRMLDHLPNRGYRVSSLSDKERADLIETRAVLERAAISGAAEKVQPADIADLRMLVRQFEDHIRRGDLALLRQLNADFHDRLYAICGNEVLHEEIKTLRRRAQNGFSGGWRTLESISRSHEDHLDMIRLLEAKDGKNLAELVDRHLNLRNQIGAE